MEAIQLFDREIKVRRLGLALSAFYTHFFSMALDALLELSLTNAAFHFG
jgi:hypothetical protein